MTSVRQPRCANPRCEVPATSFCKLDHDDFQLCPKYAEGHKESPQGTRAADAGAVPEGQLKPVWSGNAFTPNTATLVWATARPLLLALVGLPEAGKTSFLATLYLRMKRERVAGRQFNGSLTLHAWAKLASRMAWRGGRSPQYPPRTSGDAREPGFLHVSLRAPNEDVMDVLIADTPGEWYMHWISRADDPQAEGARWTVCHADQILLFVDVAALTDPTSRYSARSRTERLIDRVSQQQPTGRVSVVYAKHDAVVGGPTPVLEEIQVRLEARFPGHRAFETVAAPESQSEPGKGVAEAVGALIEQATSPTPPQRALPEPGPLMARFFEVGT